MQALGIPELGKNGLTANYPAATAFTRNGVTTYVAYNYSGSDIRVAYSDGTELNVAANSFAVKQ